MYKKTAKFKLGSVSIPYWNDWKKGITKTGFNFRLLELNESDNFVIIQFFCSDRQPKLNERKTDLQLKSYIKRIPEFDSFVTHPKESSKPEILQGIKQNPDLDPSWFVKSTIEIQIQNDLIPERLKNKGKRKNGDQEVFDMGVFDE